MFFFFPAGQPLSFAMVHTHTQINTDLILFDKSHERRPLNFNWLAGPWRNNSGEIK